MQIDVSRYRVKLAETEAERDGRAAAALPGLRRGDGRATRRPRSAAARREWDDFDPCFDHLILLSLDPAIADPLDRVVGVYRLMRGEAAARRPRLLRRGRVRPGADPALGPAVRSSSAAPASRPSTAAGRRCTCSGTGSRAYVLERGIELLFGVASFHGTDPAPARRGALLPAPRASGAARPAGAGPARALPRHEPDAARGRSTPPRALQAIPPLIKAYLRLGGFVGDGAYRRPRVQHHRRLRRDGHRAG